MKTLIILIIAAVIVGGGYMVFKNSKSDESATSEDLGMPVPGEAGTPEMVVESEKVISYTDTGYTPAAFSIKAGETVVFKNESSNNMWPASANHPTHDGYPTTGGCLGSTFDACQGIPPGGSWPFKFEVAGNWKYHDHLTSKYFGSITVE